MSTQQKNVSLRPEDLSRLREMQLEISKKVGFRTSIADVILFLITHYERSK